MAKNPILPLYYNDLDRSTRTWSDEEFGAYVRLLIEQWDKGGLPNDYQKLTRLATSLDTNWKILKEKFPLTDGLLKNPVMEEIREKQRKHKAKQKENIEKRYQKPTKLPTKLPTKTLPLENEYENENDIEEREGKEGVEEGKRRQLSEKEKESVGMICSAFGVSEQNNTQSYFAAVRFIETIYKDGRIEYFDKQLSGFVKLREPKYRGKLINFIGYPEDNYENGVWCAETYTAEEKSNTADYPDDRIVPSEEVKERLRASKNSSAMITIQSSEGPITERMLRSFGV